jgi:caffeoyl-CoA O-methyltransferase
VADAPKSFHLSPAIHEYLVAHGSPPDDVQRWLIDETKRQVPALSLMQVAPEQGAFMTLLARLLGVAQAVEVGTFTGYSALCLARGLAPGGRLVCCDVNEEWARIAREAWARAGVADRIDLRLAPAIETLQALPTDETIDLAFIDADKRSYAAYYEELLRRLRPNGVILVDNTLWMGTVVDESVTDDDTNAIRAFNDAVAADERVEAVLLPISDGLTLLRKR